MTTEPKIYVACLAAYNNGHLHGQWINLTQNMDDIWNEIVVMLKASPVENMQEWAIHDYEGFEGYSPSGDEDIEILRSKGEFIYEHGRIGGMLLSHVDGDLDEAERTMENHAGEYSDLGEFAEEITEQTMTVPDNLAYYIDYDRMGRDMELNGDVFTIETTFEEVHVFWSS